MKGATERAFPVWNQSFTTPARIVPNDLSNCRTA